MISREPILNIVCWCFAYVSALENELTNYITINIYFLFIYLFFMLNNQLMSIKHRVQLNLIGGNLGRNARASTGEIFWLYKVK